MLTPGQTVVDALSSPHPCPCDCYTTLTLEERTRSVDALYRFDDALRGWGYTGLWDLAAPRLWREAQKRNDQSYRYVAVRDEACVYRRLLGFAVHELIHALNGDVTRANYGIPFGLPYGVPESMPPIEEAAYLKTFNDSEARAWVGIAPMALRLYGVDWPLRTARDVGTYGFVGGNALVTVPTGFRAVPHYDRSAHATRYYALARRIEDEARAWFTEARVEELEERVLEAEASGHKKRPRKFPPARELASLRPQKLGRNDLCPCGSGEKWKRCCGRDDAARAR
jgi:hypothetical protein